MVLLPDPDDPRIIRGSSIGRGNHFQFSKKYARIEPAAAAEGSPAGAGRIVRQVDEPGRGGDGLGGESSGRPEGRPRLVSISDVLPGNPAALSWIGLRPVILRPTLSDGLPLSGRSLKAI